MRKIILFICIALTFECHKHVNNLADSLPCDLSLNKPSFIESYDFESNFEDYFEQSSRWLSRHADLKIVQGKAMLSANADDVSNALEAWKLFKMQMPSDRSWRFSIEVNVPQYWIENKDKNAQVGVGPFAGRPVDQGQSPKVYECNMAAISGGPRFVQAQLIKNRLGGDPDDVQFRELDPSQSQATLSIEYCVVHTSLSLFIDDIQVGKSKAIGSMGADDWGLLPGDKIDVGIMGFAEHTVISEYTPTLDNMEVVIF